MKLPWVSCVSVRNASPAGYVTAAALCSGTCGLRIPWGVKTVVATPQAPLEAWPPATPTLASVSANQLSRHAPATVAATGPSTCGRTTSLGARTVAATLEARWTTCVTREMVSVVVAHVWPDCSVTSPSSSTTFQHCTSSSMRLRMDTLPITLLYGMCCSCRLLGLVDLWSSYC